MGPGVASHTAGVPTAVGGLRSTLKRRETRVEVGNARSTKMHSKLDFYCPFPHPSILLGRAIFTLKGIYTRDEVGDRPLFLVTGFLCILKRHC
jgi:hypothetical protein